MKRSFSRKKLSCRVRPGVPLARASPRRPTSALMSDDFPTFERPAIATSGGPGSGAPPVGPAAPRKRASVMRTRCAGGSARLVAGLGRPLLRDALVGRADLVDVALADRALLERLDDARRLRLVRLLDAHDARLAAVGRLD